MWSQTNKQKKGSVLWNLKDFSRLKNLFQFPFIHLDFYISKINLKLLNLLSWTAVTEYHRLSEINNRNVYLHSFGATDQGAIRSCSGKGSVFPAWLLSVTSQGGDGEERQRHRYKRENSLVFLLIKTLILLDYCSTLWAHWTLINLHKVPFPNTYFGSWGFNTWIWGRHIQSITIPDIKHFGEGAGKRKQIESWALQCLSGHSSHAHSKYTINENCTTVNWVYGIC